MWVRCFDIKDLFSFNDQVPLFARLENDGVFIQKQGTGSHYEEPADSPISFGNMREYYIKLGPNFYNFKSKLEAELNGSAPAIANPNKPEHLQGQGIQSQTSQSEKIKPAYWITFNPNSRDIVLNDRFIVATPQFQSPNYLVFEYMFNNPGKMVTKQFLASEVAKAPIAKTLHQIVSELGFKGHLKDMFFKTNSAEIEFRPTVSEEEAMRLNTPRLRLKLDT